MTEIQERAEHGLDPFLIGKTYTLSEAARLARTSPQMVRRWLHGYHPRQADVRGRNGANGTAAVSFLELLEIVVVADFRQSAEGRKSLTVRRIQQARDFASDRLDVPYPFASHELLVNGGRVLHDFALAHPGPGVFAIDRGSRYALPAYVEDELRRMDFDGCVACRWFPLGRETPIVVDPFVAGGFPTIAGTGVTVRTVQLRHSAGESAAFIASDYSLDINTVEQALHFAAA